MKSGPLLALLAQILAVLGPGCFAVCVHDDGTSAIELQIALCCTQEQCDDECSSRGAEDGEEHVRSQRDACRDTPLVIGASATSTRGAVESNRSNEDHGRAVLAPTDPGRSHEAGGAGPVARSPDVESLPASTSRLTGIVVLRL
mgnify:CR=1 FL=1